MKYAVLAALAAMIAALALVSQGPSPAVAGDSVEVIETKRFYNDDDPIATRFQVKFWQKEDDVEVESWTIEKLDPNSGTCFGEYGWQPDEDVGSTENPHQTVHKLHEENNPDADNKKHAVDVECEGIDIGDNWRVKLRFKWVLTEMNTKRTYNAVWTHEGGSTARGASPFHGFVVGDPVPDPENPGKYKHEFQLWNDDPAQAVSVTGLKLGSRAAPLLTFEELEAFEDWSFTSDALFLPIGTCWRRNVVTDDPLVGGNVVASYTVGGLDGGIIEERLAHEVPPVGSDPPPCSNFAGPVGGIADFPALAETAAEGAVAPADGSGWSAGAYSALAGGLAVALMAFGGGAWYARRRFSRS